MKTNKSLESSLFSTEIDKGLSKRNNYVVITISLCHNFEACRNKDITMS